MRLKADDVCAIIGTHCLWQWLSPEEVVTIVGQNLRRMACDAADALASEVRRRMLDASEKKLTRLHDELVVIVILLAGEHQTREFDIGRAGQLLSDHFVS